MIRQAISCDICGAEKRQTNHWFVVYEQSGELRLSGWSSRRRLRPDSKHLCGHTCLHKLVDDFMARTIAVRSQVTETEVAPAVVTDTSLTADAAYAEITPALRLIAPVVPPTHRPAANGSAMPVQFEAADLAPLLDEPPPRYASRSRQAEAWERERERELRAAERRPQVVARRGP